MEIALAILVMAVGVVAAFSLLASGLDANATAVADTQAALFADAVFRGIEARSIQAVVGDDPAYPQSTASNRWKQFWTEVDAGTRPIVVAAPDVWATTKDADRDTLQYWSGTAWTPVDNKAKKLYVRASKTRVAIMHPPYRVRDLRTNQDTLIQNHAIRYRMDVLFSNVPVQRASVSLAVWEGAFGRSDPLDALVFYSEFNNPGDL